MDGALTGNKELHWHDASQLINSGLELNFPGVIDEGSGVSIHDGAIPQHVLLLRELLPHFKSVHISHTIFQAVGQHGVVFLWTPLAETGVLLCNPVSTTQRGVQNLWRTLQQSAKVHSTRDHSTREGCAVRQNNVPTQKLVPRLIVHKKLVHRLYIHLLQLLSIEA